MGELIDKKRDQTAWALLGDIKKLLRELRQLRGVIVDPRTTQEERARAISHANALFVAAEDYLREHPEAAEVLGWTLKKK